MRSLFDEIWKFSSLWLPWNAWNEVFYVFRIISHLCVIVFDYCSFGYFFHVVKDFISIWNNSKYISYLCVIILMGLIYFSNILFFPFFCVFMSRISFLFVFRCVMSLFRYLVLDGFVSLLEMFFSPLKSIEYFQLEFLGWILLFYDVYTFLEVILCRFQWVYICHIKPTMSCANLIPFFCIFGWKV